MLAPGQRKIVYVRIVRRPAPIVISDSEDDDREQNAEIVISDSDKSSSDDDCSWL